MLAEALEFCDSVKSFGAVLDQLDVTFPIFLRKARFALSFTLVAGVGERIS
jgi:hypothetical protein